MPNCTRSRCSCETRVLQQRPTKGPPKQSLCLTSVSVSTSLGHGSADPAPRSIGDKQPGAAALATAKPRRKKILLSALCATDQLRDERPSCRSCFVYAIVYISSNSSNNKKPHRNIRSEGAFQCRFTNSRTIYTEHTDAGRAQCEMRPILLSLRDDGQLGEKNELRF
jgi:hypothetical protein